MRSAAILCAAVLATCAWGADGFKPPALMVQADRDQPSRPLDLTRVHVDVVLAGEAAETAVTMTFFNSLDRPLEGNLYFPLPQGSSVSGYALDINGELVDAVAIDRQKARQVFEYEQRKGIDPGLLEWSKGNNFQTRVWPIPAKGTRTIRVSYLAPLSAGKQPGDLMYTLPLTQYGKLAELSARVVTPDVDLDAKYPDWMHSDPKGKTHAIEGKLQNAKAIADLTVTLLAQPKTIAVGRDPRGRDAYFVARMTPPVPPADQKQRRGGSLTVYWDASLSRANSALAKEFDLLSKVIARFAFDSVEVVAFRNVPEAPREFKVNGDPAKAATEIVDFLRKLPYDGGTNLNELAIESKGGRGFALLFSDGIADLGPDMPRRLEAPVYTIASDARANHPLLGAIATQTGGRYFNLDSTDVAAAAAQIDVPTFELIRAEYDARQVEEVFPKPKTPVNGRVTVAGRLRAPKATVVLHFGVNGNTTHRETITLDRDAPSTAGTLPARLWAQMKVDSLLPLPEQNHDELARVGKEFGLATPATSLLILETVEQYLEHGIEPPKTRAKVYADWSARIEQRKVQTSRTREEKLVAVVAMWNQRVAWWAKEYKVPPGFVFREEPKKDAAPVERRMREGREAPAPTVGEPAPARPAATPLAPPAGAPANMGRTGQGQGRGGQGQGPGQGGQGQGLEQGGGQQQGQGQGQMGNDRRSNRGEQGQQQRQQEGLGAGRRPEPGDNRGLMGGVGGGAAPKGGRRILRLDAERSAGKKSKGLARLDAFAEADDAAGARAESKFDLKAWDPKTPYVAAMEKAGPDKAYAVYLDFRFKYAKSPAFYLDCCEYFLKQGVPGLRGLKGEANEQLVGLARRILTNVLELQIEDARLMRIVAHRLQQIGDYDLAIDLFEKVQKARPEEPQSYRDLALALGDRADATRKAAPSNPSAVADYRRAVTLLNEVVLKAWDNRFPQVEVIAVAEANRLLARLATMESDSRWANPLDLRLRRLLDCDVWISMTWDTDLTDIDLWVTEPTQEKCFYGHNRTVAGGALTNDFTQGYGPEVYAIRRTVPGAYRIDANFYGTREVSLTGGTTIQATIFTNFGRPNEEKKSLTIRVSDKKEVVNLGAITR